MNTIKLSSIQTSGKELQYVQKAIERGELSNYGENLETFEYELESYFSKKSRIVLLNSGTSALHLALINLGVKSGDEVICQSFTFVASANPILYLGALPIFVDSETDTWNISPFYLEQAINQRLANGKKPKAIIVVHSYGMPCKMHKIQEISNKYDIPVIEDAAEALGSTYKGQKCGTFCEYGVISFNGNKIISTSGGGALICKTQKEKEKIFSLANQSKEDTPYYEHRNVGYNYSMSNIIAGIGCGQMEILEENIYSRRNINDFYKLLFSKVKGIKILEEINSDFFSNHWISCILIDSKVTGFTAEELRVKLEMEKIESRPLWKPMHLQPVFKDNLFFGGNISEKLFQDGLCLPSGSDLSKEDLNKIRVVIKSFFN